MTDHLNTGPFSLSLQRTIKNQLMSSSVGVGYRSQWRDLDSLHMDLGTLDNILMQLELESLSYTCL